jgi:hypothetical protein
MCFSVCYLSDVSLLNEHYWHLGHISMNMTFNIISITLSHSVNSSLHPIAISLLVRFPSIVFSSLGKQSFFAIHVKIFGRRQARCFWMEIWLANIKMLFLSRVAVSLTEWTKPTKIDPRIAKNRSWLRNLSSYASKRSHHRKPQRQHKRFLKWNIKYSKISLIFVCNGISILRIARKYFTKY